MSMMSPVSMLSIVVSLVTFGVANAASSPTQSTAAIETTLNVIEVGEPRLSPDGKWVVFNRETPDLANNVYRNEVMLAPVASADQAKVILAPKATSVPSSTLAEWSPDSKQVLLSTSDGWQIYDVGSSQMSALRIGGETTLPRGAASPRWSSDGQRLAFLAPVGPAAPEVDPNRGVELDIDWDPGRHPNQADSLRPASRAISVLHVADLRSGDIQAVTPGNQNVVSFAWAADGKRLAYSAVENPKVDAMAAFDTDLFVVEWPHKKVTSLVRQEGGEDAPVWSPDDRWIAFKSQHGKLNARFEYELAVVAADGAGAVSYPTHSVREEFSLSPASIHWSADGRSLLINAADAMRGRLVRVPRDGGRPVILTAQQKVENTTQFSFDAKGRSAVFVHQSPVQPTELYLFSAANGQTRRLTHANKDFDPASTPTVEEVAYHSFDDKWDVHAMLMKPPGFDPRRKYPLIIDIVGGPGQVRGDFGMSSTQHPLLALASRGYVVLVPNTRGRGGFGAGFAAALETERSFSANPYQDVMSGADYLIGQGFVDGERMGLVGFSYGFKLGAYTVTQTHRFKAASLGDGLIEATTTLLAQWARDWYKSLVLHQEGVGDMFDPKERVRVEQEMALTSIQNVRTPTLIICGIRSVASTQCRMLLHSYRTLDVPAELVVFPRTGHGIQELQLLRDNHERNIEWLDYWVLGKATPRMTARYGQAGSTPSP